PLQEGLFFHHQWGEDNDPYVLRQVLEFDNRERMDAFLSAWQQVIDRHDILRTSVHWEGLPHPVQVVHKTATLQVHDLPAVVSEETDVSVEDVLSRCGSTMDLRVAPLADAWIITDEIRNRWLMVLRMHHITQDHTTIDVVLREVQTILDGRVGMLAAPLPYRTFVGQALLGVSPAEHDEYFRAALGDVSETTSAFGVDQVRGDGRDVAELSSALPAEVGGRVREVARRLGVSPATVFHVIWARALAAMSGRDDVVFGTVLFGRLQAGTGADRVPGLFINTLPVRAQLHGLNVSDAVRRMQTTLADLMVHEHASLAAAQTASAVPAPAPLFTTLLNYRHNNLDDG
ncbi:condensation domain-containing protein, partial [Streptomyces tendae]|uniref:condensation domain-containing protein n=1 Tax=Streptomyces tendae TaxID=1932 RepID=UPI0036A69A31